MHWGETARGGQGNGWLRKIRYTPTEYKSLVEKVWQWRSRVEKESDESIRVIDLEKVAYVLGKGMGGGNDLVDDDDDDDDGDNYEDEGNGVEKTVQQGKDKFQAESGTKKRKAKDDAIKSKKCR